MVFPPQKGERAWSPPTRGSELGSSDVIVLGVGGMGSAACRELARRGLRVTGIEQFDVGHALGSSHGQSRMIRKAYFEHQSYVPLLHRAYALWEELSAECGEKVYHPDGIVYVTLPQSDLIEGVRKSARLHRIPLWELGAISAPFKMPDGFVAHFEPESGWLEVEACVRAQADGAVRRGARIVKERALSWSASPAGVEVVTDGGTHRAQKLVIAGGAWSEGLLRSLQLPLRVLRKLMFWFEADAVWDGAPCIFYDLPEGMFYAFPRTGGLVKAAEHSGGEPVADPSALARELAPGDARAVSAFVRAHLPGVNPVPLKHAACMYTMTPDANFIIDIHPAHPNVVFAAGFSGHGFKFAPVVGEVLADLALTGNTRHPIDFLRLR
jgi:sarcosine oxidase